MKSDTLRSTNLNTNNLNTAKNLKCQTLHGKTSSRAANMQPNTKSHGINALPLSRAVLGLPFLNFLDDSGIDPARVLTVFEVDKQVISNPNIYVPSHMIGQMVDMVATMTNQQDISYFASEYQCCAPVHPSLAKQLEQNDNIGGLLSALLSHQKLQGSHFKLWAESNQHELRIYHRSALHKNSRGFDYANDYTTFLLLSVLRKHLGESWKPDYLVMENVSAPYNKVVAQTKYRKVITGQKSNYIPINYTINDVSFHLTAENEQHAIDRLKSVIDIFWQEESFSLDFVAHLFGVSERTLQRLFLEQGSSFRHYLNEKKINKSMELLRSGMNVSDVAFKLGYSDPSNFTRAMKKQINMSPTQYLKYYQAGKIAS
ncbi:helix-turn-helix domain-containing protein [Photobacterium sanctipauli]|uniref:helix-turn-helix domain-containing protein n=1 Tax=Photobacterium sanctipauli TaxID=1342794 RepID=UPI0012689C6A|nr:AraC family transcriptional regulator [Photobacterium sanctipauli]